MPDPVIRVEGLGKRYRLGQLRHDTLRDRLAHALTPPARWGRRPPGGDPTDFWALRDVSFEVRRGEVLGIIGRNGAGKSTLLKVLSRITEPTAGRMTLSGRVASLLEVGTGFHPELSGRENVFLNGAILGMSRAEIRRKFDEIVAFAEVEKFLDTPVKHYSSGMYVRLAFAVAAHLEPEILIVDEVLAVGDAAFQQRCLGKMRELAGGGRTVLMVSHNLGIVQALCQRCLLLDGGRTACIGTPAEAVGRYLQEHSQLRWRRAGAVGGQAGFRSVAVTVDPAESPDPQVRLEIELESRVARSVELEVFLSDAFAQPAGIGAFGNLSGTPLVDLQPGVQTVTCSFPAQRLANGRYVLSFRLAIPFVAVLDEAPQAVAFELELPPLPGATRRLLQNWGLGPCLLDLRRS